MMVGCIATKVMSRLQTFCIIINLIIIIVTCIAVPIGAQNLRSAKDVFTQVGADITGVWPAGWEFFLSWLSAIWTIGAFDSCVHMSEEATNAATAVPFVSIVSQFISISMF
jgi:amino acid transporter